MIGYRELLARDGAARLGRLTTAHGMIETPAFMPVGTAATVKAMTPEAVAATGARIVLGNTYHLMLRPGAERIAALGGLHRFMNWPHAILTDSGGFQVMSLAALRKITEEGVTFRSHLDGSAPSPDPGALGRDPAPARRRHHDGVRRMHPVPGRARSGRSLDGIVDALGRALARRLCRRARATASSASCRAASTPSCGSARRARLVEIGFDGYAIGGLAIGEGQATMFAMVEATVPALPADRPRYLMGVGKPADIVGAVRRGDRHVRLRAADPLRAHRRRPSPAPAPLNLRNARHADDPAPLDADCRCPACTGFSRAYLHHLDRMPARSSASMLLTAHNLPYYADLMAGLRAAIADGTRSATFAADFAEARRAGSSAAMTREALPTQSSDPARPAPAAARIARRGGARHACPTRIPATLYAVRFTCPEFTSLCPITGQPDFAHLVIDYVPDAAILESKSLKLFLGSFRNHGAFHEDCTLGIARRLVAALRAALAAHRRLLVSARRHPDRRVLPDRRAARRAVAARPGRRALSRPRLTPAMAAAASRSGGRRSGDRGRSARSAASTRVGLRRGAALDADAPAPISREFLARGYHGDMGWLADTAARRGDPQTLWPEARTVVVLGVNYGPDDDPLAGCRRSRARHRSRSMPAAATITTRSSGG